MIKLAGFLLFCALFLVWDPIRPAPPLYGPALWAMLFGVACLHIASRRRR